MQPRRRILRRLAVTPGRILLAGAVVGVGGLLWVVLVAAPPWFVHDHSLEGLKAQNEVRTTLLQGLGGVVLLVGAYVAYRQLQLSRRQLVQTTATTQEQLQLGRQQLKHALTAAKERHELDWQGQITERFTRAIDQLGHAQIDVRLGGIYALERIARASPVDRPTIGEILTAFVRSHAPWPPQLPGQYVATAPIEQMPELQVRAPDVQACMTVLGRGSFARPDGRVGHLDLGPVDLRRVRLFGAHLERVALHGEHLEGADMRVVHLEGTDLCEAHLEGATLIRGHLEEAALDGAHLEKVHLAEAHLEGAYLANANLEKGNLRRAHLQRAALRDAHLQGADMRSADLEGTNLYSADLKDADLRGAWLDNANLGTAHPGEGGLRPCALGDCGYRASE